MKIGAISMAKQSCGIIPFSHAEGWADWDSNQINVRLHPIHVEPTMVVPAARDRVATLIVYVIHNANKYIKIKQSHYRPGQALRIPGV
jgi:hypothetical protein